MKRRRTTGAASRPVDGEVVDVSADSDVEAAKRKVLVNVVFPGAATPPSKLEIEEGTTVKQFRRSVFGLQDAGQTIRIRVGHVTMEIDQGGDLGILFHLAAKESEDGGQSEVVANVHVAPPNGGRGGIGAHGGVHVSPVGFAGGVVGGRGGGAANRMGGGGVVGGGGRTTPTRSRLSGSTPWRKTKAGDRPSRHARIKMGCHACYRGARRP